MDTFLKGYEFERVKRLALQSAEQFIANKVRKTELTEVYNEKLASEKLVRRQLRCLSLNSGMTRLHGSASPARAPLSSADRAQAALFFQSR